jgi:phi13 family phage major tail protein
MPISANEGEYKSRIGLDSLYIAEVTVDSAAAYTADTPEYLAPAAEASQTPATNAATQFADDQPYDSMVIEGETVISLTVTGIPPEMQAKLLGRQFDAVSGRVFDNPGATPPYFALSFRSLKSNGSYRYYQYLKGRFSAPTEETKTKGDTPDPKTTALTYTAIPTVFEFDIGATNESVKRVYGDDDTTNFDETGWFTQVQTPSVAAPSALALSSSVPTDGASGVSKTLDQSLTFNNALTNDAVYNAVLLLASDASVVASVITLDATKKIITINPDATLAGTTAHIIAYNVTDIYGQHLSGAINFTTAA